MFWKFGSGSGRNRSGSATLILYLSPTWELFGKNPQNTFCSVTSSINHTVHWTVYCNYVKGKNTFLWICNKYLFSKPQSRETVPLCSCRITIQFLFHYSHGRLSFLLYTVSTARVPWTDSVATSDCLEDRMNCTMQDDLKNRINCTRTIWRKGWIVLYQDDLKNRMNCTRMIWRIG